MADFPHMDWYPRDYIADTRHLTPEQRGCYSDLLSYAWLNGAQLPDDDGKLARMCGVTKARFTGKIRPALAEFWTIENGVWIQKRQQKEFMLVEQKVGKLRANASLGGKAKALNQKKSVVADASQMLAENPSKTVPITEADSESKKETPPLSPPKGAKKRKRSWPDELVLTPELRGYAEDKHQGCDPSAMWEQFENHHRAKGSMFVDWNRAWYSWVNSPYEKPMNGASHHERSCAVQGRPNQPGGPHKKPGSFVEASRQVLALRSRQS